MFAEEFLRAAKVAPRDRLDGVISALWKAYAAGGVTDDEAAEVSAIVEARRRIAAPAVRPVRLVPRSRSPESVERRRGLAASGWIPPRIARSFTLGEAAALAVVAREIAARGSCDLCHNKVAALAGVGKTTVCNALRQARLLGLVSVEERRVSAFRNDPNVVRVVDPLWSSWLSMRSRNAGGSAVSLPTRTYTQELRGRKAEPSGSRKGLPGRRVGNWTELNDRPSRHAGS